jgi:phenylpropionate dioxygenase-like ring-hydroxylating dioxygenase large terminal subunit
MSTVFQTARTQVTADPARSFSLPGWAYTDPDIFELEKREIFQKTWQYAGAIDALERPGDYITVQAIDQSLIIIRGDDGDLKGFHNVCQHRGHQLLAGRGCVAAISCPYHAWAYRLDGTLRNARGAERTEGFDAGAFGLKPVRVEVLAGKLVFYNLDMDARPLGEQVGDLVEDIRREVPDFDRLKFASPEPLGEEMTRMLAPMKANWKVVMDNFLECYHCRCAHPGFSDDVIMESYKTTAHGLWSKQKGGTRRPNGAEVVFWSLFPNTTFSTTTRSGPNFSARVFVTPISATLTARHRADLFRVPGEPVDDQRPDWGPLGQEDRDICESVQRGLMSMGYDAGRFIYDFEHGETSEEAVHLFHRGVVEALRLQPDE